MGRFSAEAVRREARPLSVMKLISDESDEVVPFLQRGNISSWPWGLPSHELKVQYVSLDCFST